MTVYYFVPELDDVIGAGWTYGGGTAWNQVNGGPFLNMTNYMEHTGPVGTNNNTSAKLHAADPSGTINASSFFGDTRVYGVRIGAWASLYEQANAASYAIRLDYGSGEMDETIINFPGTHPEQTVMGPLFLEFLNSFHSKWVYTNPLTGADFTSAQLDAMKFVCRATGRARVYELWLDVDLRIRCQVVPGTPHYPSTPMSPWSPITWGFNNAGDGVQKKYQVRVFTLTDYLNAVSSGDIWTYGTYTLDSGPVRSSRTFHDFGKYVGGKKIPGLLPSASAWYVAIRVCKDYKGQDWWSNNYVQTVLVTAHTDTVTFPTSGALINTTSRPVFTCTTTITSGKLTGSDWRIYRKPGTGWPTGFDPDTTDITPFYSIHLDGSATSMQPSIEYSLSANDYKLAVRHYGVDFDEPTPWAVQDFTMGAPAPPSIQSYTFTADPANNRYSYDMQWYSNAKVDEVQAVKVLRLATNYPNENVRLDTPDLDHGLLPLGVRLPGTSGHYISIPNATTLHSTSIEVEGGLFQSDWTTIANTTLAARWLTGTNFRSWWFRLKSDRTLELQWSTAGTAGTVVTATSTTGLPAMSANTEVWFRAKQTITNPYTVTFYWSSDKGFNWNQLGSVITGGAATSVFDTTTNGVIEVGATDTGTANLAVGIHTHFLLKSTVNGTVILSWDGTGQNALRTYVGTPMTINGTNSSFYYRVTGFDYEAPNNATGVFYSPSYMVRDTTANEYQFSSGGLAAPGAITKYEVWIKPIGVNADAARVLMSDSWVTNEVRKIRNPRQPLGRTYPVVNKSVNEKGESFTYNFTVMGSTAIDRMIRVLDSGSTFVLSTPKKRYYVELSDNWSMKEQIFDTRKGEQDARIFTVPLIEVAQPYVPSFT